MKFLKEAEKKPYGDVEYADPGYQEDGQKRYPIDTEEHIRAAWNYISKPKNVGKYSSEDASKIKAKVVAAWKKKIDKDGPPSAAEKSLGQVEGGLEMGLYEPDPVLDGIELPPGVMLVAEPMGYNSTDICMELSVQDGRLCARRLVLNNYDSDPQGKEEEPGSADEAREQAHYSTVMACVAAFLGAGEPEEEDTTKSTKKAVSPDQEGEATDDVNDDGSKRGPKEAAVPVKEDLEPSKKKKKEDKEACVEVSLA